MDTTPIEWANTVGEVDRTTWTWTVMAGISLHPVFMVMGFDGRQFVYFMQYLDEPVQARYFWNYLTTLVAQMDYEMRAAW